MSSCDRYRDLFTFFLDGDLDETEAKSLTAHLEICTDCSELLETVRMVAEAGSSLGDLRPPPRLAATVAGTMCERWLGLLFQAVDREISDFNLERLLAHLEECEACQEAWNDMTLIHQIGEELIPPPGLKRRCVELRRAVSIMPVIGRRTATVAAYFLAILTSLVVGNPVTLARNPAATAVRNVVENVTIGVSEVTTGSRGEFRVILWRAWQWGSKQATALQTAFADFTNDDDSHANQGEQS